MQLPKELFHALFKALISAFDDENSLRKLVRLSSGKHLDRITTASGTENKLRELIECAERENWLGKLIKTALKEREENPKLKRFCEEFQKDVEKLEQLDCEAQKEAVCRFLEAIENKFNTIRLFHDQEIILKDQYIPIEVTFERHYRYEGESNFGYAENESERFRAYALKGRIEEEEEEKEKRTQVPWQEAKQEHTRLIVLADPGMGKTALLKMEAVTTAREQRQQLLQHTSSFGVEDVIFPLFLRLSDLAEQDEEIMEAIPKLIQRGYRNTAPAVLPLIEEKLKNGKCLVLLDALDEVPREGPKSSNSLLRKLEGFVDSDFSCPVVITSRIVGYGDGFFTNAKEVEIVPFTSRQIGTYIVTWFKNLYEGKDTKEGIRPDARGLIDELNQKPQIHGLAQNPLLLSLLCSLYQHDQLTLPARRVEIYKRTVDYMLGDWNRNRKNQNDVLRICAKLELLEELAYQFSCEYKEIFSADKLYKKFESYLKTEDSTVFRNSDSATLFTELSEEDGIIQQLDGEGSNIRYIFLHRTFQEYLTASYLKRQTNGIKLAKAHFWDLDWHETLILFAGLLDKPEAFLNSILAERDDIFYTLLLLAGKCLAESPQLEMPQLIDRLYKVWGNRLHINFVEPTVVAVGQIHQRMVIHLLTTLHEAKRYSAWWAANTLKEIGNVQAVEGLLTALHNVNHEVHWAVGDALGRIRSAQTMERLLAALQDPDKDVRRHTARALGMFSAPRAVEELLAALHDPDKDVRSSVAEALGQLRNTQAMEGLLHDNTQAMEGLLAALHDPDKDVRSSVAKALGQLRNTQAMEGLLAALHDPDKDVRSSVARALGELGDPRALEGVLTVLHDPDDTVRRSTMMALGNLGDLRAVEGLLAALRDPDKFVRWYAAEALGKIGDARAVKGLLAALRDSFELVRSSATEALGNLGDPRAVEDLLTELHDPNEDVRSNAAEALGELGDLRAVKGLLAALCDPFECVRSKAAEALGELGDLRAVKGLLAALCDPFECVRSKAAEALGELGDPRAVEDLLTVLHDPNEDVKWQAARALGRLGDARGGKSLLAALHNPDEDIRDQALEVLSWELRWELGDAQKIEGLLVALRAPFEGVRRTAVEALGELGDPRAIKDLLAALHDPEEDVRAQAAEALGNIGTLDVLEKLLHRLDIDIYDEDIFPVVRRLALKFSQQRPQPDCLTVYPQPRGLRWLRKKFWRWRIFLNTLRQKINAIKWRDWNDLV